MKMRYNLIILLFGGLLLTGCSDFLDQKSKDSVSEEDYFTTDDQLFNYTKDLYGGLTWNTYMQKFIWCAHEVMSGNIYHEYSDEGQFFFFTYNNTNSILEDGYKCLYNGPISEANNILSREGKFRGNGISDDAVNRAKGEALMFRGMAYFLLTELWGETPLITDNAKIIGDNTATSIPKATRGSLYAQIEKDWLKAAELLPAEPWQPGRVSQMSAYGMLAKLYVTMAACGTNYGGVGAYQCPDPAGYYKKAIDILKTPMKNGMTLLNYCEANMEADYNKIFDIKYYSKESLFALEFYNGPYGMGSPLQIQWSRSKSWNGGLDSYGGGKGLTVTLFNSYEANDMRKKATSLYPGETYAFYDGSPYIYHIDPSSILPEPPYGSEDRGNTLNGLKKYVYGYLPTGDRFSCPMNIQLLRTADVLLLYAEAKLFESGDHDVQKTVGGEAVDYINKVRARAKLSPISAIAFWTPATEQNAKDADIKYTPEGSSEIILSGDDIKEYRLNDCLMLERRWEFALEFQNWLDIKRLYYRNQNDAAQYIKEQDRAFKYGKRLGYDGSTDVPEAYQRQKYIYLISKQLDDVQVPEGTVYYNSINWFLPLPKNIVAYAKMQEPAVDFTGEIQADTYPY